MKKDISIIMEWANTEGILGFCDGAFIMDEEEFSEIFKHNNPDHLTREELAKQICENSLRKSGIPEDMILLGIDYENPESTKKFIEYLKKETMIEILIADGATIKEAEKMLACRPGMPGSVEIFDGWGDYKEAMKDIVIPWDDEIKKAYEDECAAIAAACEESGYPSHGANYDLGIDSEREFYEERNLEKHIRDIKAGKFSGEINVVRYAGKEYIVQYIQ